MKVFRFLGLKTRKFAGWHQAFNVLCGCAALSIAGFGVMHLRAARLARGLDGVVVESAGSGRAGWRVDAAGLGRRLEETGGDALLAGAARELERAIPVANEPPREIAFALLDEAAAACLPGSLGLESELAADATELGAGARLELACALGLEATTPVATLQARARESLRQPPADVSLALAARGILGSSALTSAAAIASSNGASGSVRALGSAALRRQRAIERVVALRDMRGFPLLLLGVAVPAGEETTRAEAERGLEALAPDAEPEGNGTAEVRYVAWWMRHGGGYTAPPFDLSALAQPLRGVLAAGTPDARAQALRGLALLRDAAAQRGALDLLESNDPLARATAAWALGRIGGQGAAEPLAEATRDPVLFVRVAAARAIGQAHLEGTRAALAALAGDADEECRLAASLALLAFGEPGALAAVDAVAFDARRSPPERLHVLEALEQTGDAAASSSRWIAALSDPDARVRDAARAALARRHRHGGALDGRAAFEAWWRERYGPSGLGIPEGIKG